MPQKPIIWTGVGVDVQTDLSPSVTIDSISKANPAVVTFQGSNAPEAGNWVVLSVSGMEELGGSAFQVANVSTNTFELVGVDTTGSDDFVAGSFSVVELDASFVSVQEVAASGGEYETTDLTTIHDRKRKNENTVAGAVTYTFTNLFVTDDPGFIECRKASRKQSDRVFLFRFPTGVRMAFLASVGASAVPGGSAHQAATHTITLQLKGEVTIVNP